MTCRINSRKRRSLDAGTPHDLARVSLLDARPSFSTTNFVRLVRARDLTPHRPRLGTVTATVPSSDKIGLRTLSHFKRHPLITADMRETDERHSTRAHLMMSASALQAIHDSRRRQPDSRPGLKQSVV
jgi:hypothetical protein